MNTSQLLYNEGLPISIQIRINLHLTVEKASIKWVSICLWHRPWNRDWGYETCRTVIPPFNQEAY